MSEKPKNKYWQDRGGVRKAVSFKLPVTVINQIDALALEMHTSKTSVIIAAINNMKK
tara:strand:- start:406 stop:576 length:171 start_codon:yes stop_codon:yes gene_type:complete